ncbi:hypothetical protein BV898_12843 [Hypsibius exemplaris]|uniref:Transposase Tc5 C-terminal domain-containing protein n=1 Tax=Hypsibius exemplaris TaxID=2072580 RepID=A0A1W0WCM9_HYPEX|nr:hypothetical protein BV898_12843 [Hypsibius exemplaris]
MVANKSVGCERFRASRTWVAAFKEANGIVSRKITRFVTRSSIDNETELMASAETFVVDARRFLWSFGTSHVKNSDQSGFNRELHTGRTLDFKGVKNVQAQVQQISATTHSYTIMPIVSASGVLEPFMLVVIQEPSGDFGPRVKQGLFQAPNLVVRASKSAGGRTALLVDSWPAFTDATLLEEANLYDKEVEFAIIPAGTTGMIQPFDVYGFRPWKCFFRHIQDQVVLHDLPVVLHQRNSIIKLQSLALNQFCAPRFVPMWRYGWKKAGYLDEAADHEKLGEFLTPVQFCFTGQESIAADECFECEGEPLLHFITCSWCKSPISSANYVHDVWFTSLYKLCQPFLILMRIGGLFFIHPHGGPISDRKILEASSATLTSSSKPGPTKWERFERISIVYSFLVLSVGLLFGAKFVYTMVYGLSRLATPLNRTSLGLIVSHSAYLGWIVQMILGQIIFLRACLRPSSLTEFFLRWESLRYFCADEKNCSSSPSFGKDFCWRRNVISFLAVLHCILQWMSVDFPLLLPGGILTAFVYVVPGYFFTLIAVTLSRDFLHLQRDFEVSIKDDGVVTIKSLEWFRQRHNSLCILVDMADEVYSPWIALTLGCNVIQVLSHIFLLAINTGRWSIVTDLTQAYWMLTYFLQMAVILYCGSMVSEAAQGPLRRLYQIDQSRLTVPESLQLQTFLHRLTPTPIGFTAWRMLPINYGALLVMLGTYVIYQLLLFQLVPSGGKDPINTVFVPGFNHTYHTF